MDRNVASGTWGRGRTLRTTATQSDCKSRLSRCPPTKPHLMAQCPNSSHVNAPPPPRQIGGHIRPTLPICSADLLGFCDFADSFCHIVGASGILGHRGITLSCASFTSGHWIIPFLSILVLQIGTMECFYCPEKDAPLFPWIHCPPLIKLFCGTSTLMLVRGQFATCVFALHAPVRSSPAVLTAPHHQPPNQCILGCRCLRLL